MAVETRAAIDLGASLAQALRYVNAWKSKTVVVKYGGSVMTSRVGRADGAAGGAAVGISGKDGKVFVARKLDGPEDLGQVGEVESVDTTVVRLLSTHGFVPVIASIGIGQDGESLNLNADHAAGALAAALGASKFILLTDVPGILPGAVGGQPISTLRAEEARHLINDGVVSQGMIPKVEACLAA